MFRISLVLWVFGLFLSTPSAMANCVDNLTAGPWDQIRNEKLIHLLIENGIDFRPGDKVFVAGPRYQTPFVDAVAKELERRGAGSVRIYHGYDYAELKAAIRSGETPEHFAERMLPKALVQEAVQEKYSMISIGGSNEIGIPEGFDPHVWARYRLAVTKTIQPYAELMMSGVVPWTLIELPTPLQAHLVAPDLSPQQALQTLKQMVSDVYWLDTPNPSDLWRTSSESIEARGARLNALGIKKLHYQGPGTDLTVELHARARWVGGRTHLNGRVTQANFPTFENYVTPMYRSTQGYVKVQRPLPMQNILVRGAWFKFENGQVVDFGADEGLIALEKFFEQDPRNRFLGEVALVDDDSPVNQQERSFYSIVFDENALSHIALGAAYPTTFADPQPASDADYEAVQMNSIQTLGHTDFMIGSPNLSITAETYDGRTVPIMRNGKIILSE